jgi:hypothetical protein
MSDPHLARAASRRIPVPGPPLDPERKAACRPSLLDFCRSYLAARFPLPFSPDHLRVIELLQRTILEGDLLAVAMPRGSGKTTIMESAVLWATLYAHRQFVFVVAADAAAAHQIVASIRAEMDGNETLRDDFPEATGPIWALEGIARRAEGQQLTDGRQTKLLWTKDEVRLPITAAGGGSVFRSAGITGRIRGAKATMAAGAQVRPDLVLVDDPQTDESARSTSQVEARLKTMQSTILGLAGPGRKIACLCACTIIVRGDLAEQMLDRKAHPEWQGLRCKLLASLPAKLDRWDAYAEILRTDLAAEAGMERATSYYAMHRDEMDAGALPSWPERYAPGELSAIQHAMNLRIVRGADAFASEYQNEPLDLNANSEVDQITAPLVLRKTTALPPGLVPDEAVELTAGIDIGEHVLWWTVAAWGPGLAGDIIAYGPYPDPGRAYVTAREMRGALAKTHPLPTAEDRWRAALDELGAMIFARDWLRADGEAMRVSLGLIDAGFGDSTDTIYSWIGRSAFKDRIIPSHGRGIKPGQALLTEWRRDPGDRVGAEWRIPGKRRRQVRHCLFDADYWKSIVAQRVLAPPGTGLSIHSGSHRMLADHLSAETRMRVTAMGRTRDQWTIKPNSDNHLFDTAVLAAVAASIRGIQADMKEPSRKSIVGGQAKPSAAQTAQASATAATDRVRPPPQRRPRAGGWLSGYGGKL